MVVTTARMTSSIGVTPRASSHVYRLKQQEQQQVRWLKARRQSARPKCLERGTPALFAAKGRGKGKGRRWTRQNELKATSLETHLAPCDGECEGEGKGSSDKTRREPDQTQPWATRRKGWRKNTKDTITGAAPAAFALQGTLFGTVLDVFYVAVLVRILSSWFPNVPPLLDPIINLARDVSQL